MLVYKDNGSKKVLSPINNTTRILSSVTGSVKEIIKTKFPKDYFKRIHIATEEAISQQHNKKGGSIDVYSKELPFLSINPSISQDINIEGMERSPLVSMSDTYLYTDLKRNYSNILFDTYDGNEIYYAPVYTSMGFDCNLTVRTYDQNVNIFYHMNSVFKYNTPHYYDNIPVEYQIPKAILMTIAHKRYGDRYLEAEEPGTELELDFQRYLQAFSGKQGLIVKKRNNSSGKTEYFFRTTCNLLVQVEPPSQPEQKQLSGQKEEEYQVNFRITTSLYIPNNYIMNLTDMSPALEDIFQQEQLNSLNYVWNYSPAFPRSEFFKFKADDGSEVVAREILWESLIPEVNEPIRTIPFGKYANPDMREIISYCIKQDIDLSDVFYHRVFIANYAFKEFTNIDGEEFRNYNVDWETMTLTLEEDIVNEIITLGFYIERLKYEQLVDLIRNKELRPTSETLGELTFGTGEGSYTVPVYKFMSDKQKMATTGTYMFRTMTKHGIGYIKLGDEKSTLKDDEFLTDIKVCIDVTDGQSLIKTVIGNKVL